MPRPSGPKIHKLVLYNTVYILDENGNRTDENRPSKKDPRIRKNRKKIGYNKHSVRKKKKYLGQKKYNQYEHISSNFGSSNEPKKINNFNDNDNDNNNNNNNFFNNFSDEEYDLEFFVDFDDFFKI